MKLIVGLGNPGKEYEKTRHNMGFMVIDKFADSIGASIDQKDFKGLCCKTKFHDEVIFLLKPQTYMNLSGQSVLEVCKYFKIELDDVIVIYDDLALEPGKIRLRMSGSSGGQKGMQNIIELLKSDKIKRIRVGVGEPYFNVVDYVLGKPSKEEQPLIDHAQDKAVDALKEALSKSFNAAMSKYN